MFWDAVGITAGVLTMFGFVPQVIKIYRTKSVRDISLVTVLQFMVGIFLWFIYGIHLRNFALIMANGVTLVTIIIALVLFVRYSSPSYARRAKGGT